MVLKVGAFGGPPLSYQWQKNGADLPDGGTISGVTTATLSISGVLQEDAADYSVVVSNPYSVINSSVATLTVNDPFITTQPANRVLAEGATAVLSVAAAGTPTLTYQWYKDGELVSDAGRISGAQTATLTITSFSAGDVGVYFVIVNNGLGGSVTSANAELHTADPSIVIQPQSVTNRYGTTASFTVTPSGTAPFSYRWHKAGVGDLADGGNISGSTTAVLTISGVAYPDSGTYSVTVANALGVLVDSAPAELTVKDPVVVTQPVSVASNPGTTATFQVAAVGTPDLTYQWQKNGAAIFDVGNYSGTATDTLEVFDVSAADTGNYRVVVTGGYGNTETSADATLTVRKPVEITVQPTPRTVTAGSKAVLAVGVTGTAPQYQWQLEGADLPGATAAAYILENVQPGVTGNYQVLVSNPVNSQTSSVAVVSIIAPMRLEEANVVAIRIGDGAQTLSGHGNSMFLDQFAPDGSYVSTVTIPDTGPSSLVAIGPNVVTSPSSVTGNGLSRSANGRFLVLGGYNTNLSYTEDLQNALAKVVPRGIGLIDDRGQYTLAISSTSQSSGNFWRGAVADGTNNYWGFSRTSSSYYFGFDAPGVILESDWLNLRSMAIFNGSIYGVSAVADKSGVMRLTGLPTAPVTLEWLINSAAVLLNWGGSFFLQSATNVTGPYEDVINGTRPYTRSTSSEGERFFRLHQ